jgi:hypothetical protein
LHLPPNVVTFQRELFSFSMAFDLETGSRTSESEFCHRPPALSRTNYPFPGLNLTNVDSVLLLFTLLDRCRVLSRSALGVILRTLDRNHINAHAK